MSGRAIVAFHGDGNLSNSLARLSIPKVNKFSHSIFYIHSACFPAFDQFCSSLRHTPRFVDLFSVAGPKIKFGPQSPDNLHWLIVSTGDSPSRIRHANASL